MICHHTDTPFDKVMPTRRMLVEGVDQGGGKRLPGPLAQLGLRRDGTFFIVAAGRANHAAVGSWIGRTNGNMDFVGIEAENRGTATDPLLMVQLDAYRRGVAAILKLLGSSADLCAAHREYGLPKGRKPDPHTIEVDDFRRHVAALMLARSAASGQPHAGFRHWRWHLDEMYVKLNGEMVYLWRAGDHEGEILKS